MADPGDICPVDLQARLLNPFVVETKMREGWDLQQLIKTPKADKNVCPVLSWYFDERSKQVEANPEFDRKILLLVFSKNYETNYVMWNKRDVIQSCPGIVMSVATCETIPRLEFVHFEEQFVITNLQDFFNTYSWQELLE